MDRKGHLLSHLKKQVMTLRNQLERIVSGTNSHLASRHAHSRHSPSHSPQSHSQSHHSPRFDSVSFDSTYLERGIRKFPLADSKFRNIAQVIEQKSHPQRTPRLSSQRRAEIERTNENFSNEARQPAPARPRSPNPLTGQGYSSKKEGRRMISLAKSPREQRPNERRHFFTQGHF